MIPQIVKQCRSCPWRVDCEPDNDIPGYSKELHEKLRNTISSGLASLRGGRVMACHYSKPGTEFPCAGWLENQCGVGNNLWVRMAMARGQLPVPEIDGEQVETFEETIR